MRRIFQPDDLTFGSALLFRLFCIACYYLPLSFRSALLVFLSHVLRYRSLFCFHGVLTRAFWLAPCLCVSFVGLRLCISVLFRVIPLRVVCSFVSFRIRIVGLMHSVFWDSAREDYAFQQVSIGIFQSIRDAYWKDVLRATE